MNIELNYSILLEAGLVAVVAVWIAELSGLPRLLACTLRISPGRLKPLDCPLCLGWWLGLAWFLCTGHGLMAVPLAALASLAAVWMAKQLRG